MSIEQFKKIAPFVQILHNLAWSLYGVCTKSAKSCTKSAKKVQDVAPKVQMTSLSENLALHVFLMLKFRSFGGYSLKIFWIVFNILKIEKISNFNFSRLFAAKIAFLGENLYSVTLSFQNFQLFIFAKFQLFTKI